MMLRIVLGACGANALPFTPQVGCADCVTIIKSVNIPEHQWFNCGI